jgi:hypothetical protein
MSLPWQATVLLLAVACSSSAPASRPPAPVPAPRPSLNPGRSEPAREAAIRYPRSGGGIQRYALARRDSVVATMPTGEEQMQVQGRTAFVTITWVAADSGTRITAQVDSLAGDSGLTTFEASLDSARGVRWTGLRLPDGTLSLQSGGRGSLIGDQVRDQVALLYPVLPPDGVRPGDAWSDSTTRPTRVSAFEANETAITFSRALPPAAGTGGLEVALVRNRNATGEGTQFGQPISVLANGTDTLTYQLAADGRVLQVEGYRITDVVVTLPSIGQTVPARESSILRMTLLR